MDYRNADASIAEMCGNGLRVFVRHLIDAGLADAGTELVIGTRAGALRARVEADDRITVDLGVPQLPAAAPSVLCGPMAMAEPGRVVLMPNPHVVVELSSTAELAGLELADPPRVVPELPTGQNVEFVVPVGERHLLMRVHERGVGRPAPAVPVSRPSLRRGWTLTAARTVRSGTPIPTTRPGGWTCPVAPAPCAGPQTGTSG